jgi:haloacetate dehalogenase
MSFFDGFALEHVELPQGTVRLRHGGSGPPLLLIHGNPQTHAMWHAVAGDLRDSFHVICPDLRGYGQSFKPEATGDHAPYAKREMAKDAAAIMSHFGHERFFVGAHDRGARVSHRLALDFPERVERLAVLDIVPTIEHFERTDMDFAMGYYHWFWLAQPHPYPEIVINEAPEVWFRNHTNRPPDFGRFFHEEAYADYLEAARNPEMIRGMCEDYRAAATIDLVHDRESREAGKKIRCPLMVLWGDKGKIGKWYDPPAIWADYAADEVTGGPVDSGHYLAEEAPGEVVPRFREFFEAD